jgi:hypothetical protein
MALVGDKADYGLLSVNALGIDALNIPKGFWLPGSASVFNGYFGAGALVGYGQGSLIAGPGPFPYTSHMFGVNLVTGSHITNGVRITNGIDLMTGKKATVASSSWNVISPSASINSKSARITATKTVITGASVQIAGNVKINGLNSATGTKPTQWDAKKNFDINHPSKEGHRLRYVCLEGPSADVFFRGKLENESTIKLPEYWRNLVDPESISVNLTPIGTYQELFVERIELGQNIIVKDNLGGTIRCHYVVYGERADVEKNIPEYKGLTPLDYPGDNRQCNINGL